MTRPHVHRWALGEPVGPDVWGQCACGAAKRYDAAIPADAHLRLRDHKAYRHNEASREQLADESQRLSAARRLALS